MPTPLRRTTRFLAAWFCLCLVWLSAGTAVFGQSRYIGWHSDLKSAAEQAAASGKPLMVVFRCVR
jgi:hypothetical protein